MADGVFKVLATNGDTHLGGEDFDRVIVDHLADKFAKDNGGLDLRKDRVALQRLKEAAEKAKHELSSSLETEINLPFIAADATGPKHLVTHAQALRARDPRARTSSSARSSPVAARSRRGPRGRDIDEVILVGGMTRMPLVQRKVAEFFGRAPHKGVNPDEVVAVGAAIQGAAMTGEMERCCSSTSPRSPSASRPAAASSPLIPRNTTIPTSAKRDLHTSVDNQSFVPIHVLQGEREMAADNKSLAASSSRPSRPRRAACPRSR
jgi:molecular chaperone DnaK